MNDKQRKKFILDNYFKGTNSSTKLPGKYKMEKASHEFSKLFNYDDKIMQECHEKRNIFKKLRKVLDNNNYYYFENELNQSIKYFMEYYCY